MRVILGAGFNDRNNEERGLEAYRVTRLPPQCLVGIYIIVAVQTNKLVTIA
jgi:hypothetical protein